MSVIDRIYVEDGFVIPKWTPLNPFSPSSGGVVPTTIRVGDEDMRVVDSGPGWADVERFAPEETDETP
jgi:hypothetical protein